MKVVCEALGLARSHVHTLKHRPGSWSDGRKGRTPRADEQLLIDIRQQIAELPSYGYRRACALVNRERRLSHGPRVNPKRVYRVMAPMVCCCLARRGAVTRVGLTRARRRSRKMTCTGTPTPSRSSATVRLLPDGHRRVRQGCDRVMLSGPVAESWLWEVKAAANGKSQNCQG